MTNFGHEAMGGADASSRTLVSGQARSRSPTHSGSGPAPSQCAAYNQRAQSASTGTNTPSVLAGVIMLSGLYLWWANVMTMRLIQQSSRRQSG